MRGEALMMIDRSIKSSRPQRARSIRARVVATAWIAAWLSVSCHGESDSSDAALPPGHFTVADSERPWSRPLPPQLTPPPDPASTRPAMHTPINNARR
jgi:hypothetical protein